MTIPTLKSLCNNASFNLYWKKTTVVASSLDINEPTLPCHQKASCQIDEGSTPTFHEKAEDYYRVDYFDALDLAISCIESHFDQPGYKTYEKVQTLLQLQSHMHMMKRYNLLFHFMILILILSCFQYVWK